MLYFYAKIQKTRSNSYFVTYILSTMSPVNLVLHSQHTSKQSTTK